MQNRTNNATFFVNFQVRLAGRLNLVARKAGRVRFSCEIPDLNWSNKIVDKFYGGRAKGIPFYKKYIHVIPDPQDNKFKCIAQV